MKIKQAFIFAAGRGERMRPITDTIPKPLVKINGKAIIDYTIEKLSAAKNIEKIIINGFYLADEMEKHLKNLQNPKIIFSREVEKVETGGALIFAQNLINLNEPLLTINGDVLWLDEGGNDINLLDENWQKNEGQNNCEMLLGLKETADYFGYENNENGGDFKLEENGILSKNPQQKLTHAFVGMQIINPKILQKAPSKSFSMSHFYKNALDENGVLQGVRGLELEGKYFHIGTPQAIKETENLIKL